MDHWLEFSAAVSKSLDVIVSIKSLLVFCSISSASSRPGGEKKADSAALGLGVADGLREDDKIRYAVLPSEQTKRKDESVLEI